MKVIVIVMWEKPGAHSGSLIESLRSDDRIQDFYGRPLRHHDCPLLAACRLMQRAVGARRVHRIVARRLPLFLQAVAWFVHP